MLAFFPPHYIWAIASSTKRTLEAVLTGLVQAHDVVPQVGAAGGGHDLDPAHVLADLNADLTDLQGKLPGGYHHHGYGEKESEVMTKY